MAGVIESDLTPVLGYSLLAVLFVVVGVGDRRRLRPRTPPPPSTATSTSRFSFWFVVSVVFVIMAVSRGIDLGDLFGETGRRFAEAVGWYDRRRPVQAVGLLVALSLICACTLIAIRRWLQRADRDGAVALATAALAALAAARIVSLHQVDSVLEWEWFGTEFGRLLELATLVVAIALTARPLRRGGWGETGSAVVCKPYVEEDQQAQGAYAPLQSEPRQASEPRSLKPATPDAG